MRNKKILFLTLLTTLVSSGFSQNDYFKRSFLLPFSSQNQEYMVRKDGNYYVLNDDIIVGHDFQTNYIYGIDKPTFKWPNAEIPVVFDQSLVDNEMMKMVCNALNTINRQLELSIVPRKNQKDFVKIQFSSTIKGVGQSFVGRQGGEQPLFLAKGANEATVLHEFLHAAGIYHEQSRNDRDGFIRILKENLLADTEHNFQIEPGLAQGPYDFCSIMHYHSAAFSKNRQATIECLKEGKVVPCPPCMGQYVGFSAQDIAGLDQFYNEVNRAPSNYKFDAISEAEIHKDRPVTYIPGAGETNKDVQFGNLLTDSMKGIASVSRLPNTMENWWIGKDGTIKAAYWYEGSTWKYYQLGKNGAAAPNGGIVALSRAPNTLELWWVGANGSIQGAYWYEGQQWNQYELAPAGSAAATSRIAAVSRSKGTMELWWISPNGSVQGAYWYEGQAWKRYELAPANAASATGGLTVVSRIPGSMEVWWTGQNGSVQGAYWYENQSWKRYELAPAGSVSLTGNLAVVSRIPGSMELWWIGSDGSVQGAYWYEGQQWKRYQLAPAGSAALEGGIEAVARIKNSLELWYVGANGSVQGKYWYEGGNWASYELAPAGSAARRSSISALARIPGSMELWWIGTNGSVQAGYWYEKSLWKRYELASAP